MTSSDETTSDTPTSYLDLIVGRRDGLTPPHLAKRLHEQGSIYVVYGALDGVSNFDSSTKLGTDLIFGDKDLAADKLHDILVSPEGIIAAAAIGTTMVLFSTLGNYYKDSDENRLKRWIAISWPYVRDTIKALKNAYKGWRSTLEMATVLGAHDLAYLIAPVGLLLGGLAVLNRLWLRHVISVRKDMMKANAKLLQKLQTPSELTIEYLDKKHKTIRQQSLSQKRLGLLSAAYGGIIDGMYLYIGILGLSSLAPPVFVAMFVFSTFYVLTCVATRVYEEHDFQRKLHIAQAKIDMVYSGNKMLLLAQEIDDLAVEISEATEFLVDEMRLRSLAEKQDNLRAALAETVELFRNSRENFRFYTTLSYGGAILAGAKTGLFAYGSLTSTLFAIGTILTLCSASFPPALLIVGVSLGMALLLGFIAHSMIQTYRHRQKQEIEIQKELEFKSGESTNELNKIYWLIAVSRRDIERLKPPKIREAVQYGIAIDPSPQFFYEEWFSVTRSSSSSIPKGSKFILLAFNFLKIINNKGHYEPSPLMIVLMPISMLLHLIVFGLRDYARMGRETLEAPFLKNSKKASDSESEAPSELDFRKDLDDELDVGYDDSESDCFHDASDEEEKRASQTQNVHGFFYSKFLFTPNSGNSKANSKKNHHSTIASLPEPSDEYKYI